MTPPPRVVAATLLALLAAAATAHHARAAGSSVVRPQHRHAVASLARDHLPRGRGGGIGGSAPPPPTVGFLPPPRRRQGQRHPGSERSRSRPRPRCCCSPPRQPSGALPSMVSWDDLALDYEARVEPITSSFVDEMTEPFGKDWRRRQQQGGRRPKLLDVGCGTGGPALRAASLGFDVTAVDSDPAVVARLSQRLASPSAAGCAVECTVADGQSLPPGWSSTFDYCASAFSVVYFPDPSAGLAEMERCLVPGGRCVVSGWGDRSDSPAFRIVPDAVRSVAPELVAGGGGGSGDGASNSRKLYVESADAVRKLMENAGFVDVEVKDGITRTMTVESPAEYYRRFALGSPQVRAMVEWMVANDGVAGTGTTMAEAFKAEVERLAAERGGGRPVGPVEIVSPAYFVYGTKPTS